MSRRSRAQSPQGTMLCRMATDHGVAARFYLLVIVFLPFRHLLPWLLLGWPGGVASSYSTCYLYTGVASYIAHLHR